MKAQIPDLTDEEVDLTPMIDIVFLLITFFMVVAAQITTKIEIEMPEADRAKVPDDTNGRMEVSVQNDGKTYIGLVPVTLNELAQQVRQDNETIPGFKVYVRADASVPHRHVRDVMETCAEAGVFNVIFANFQ